jgi:DNA excision repair protein ERCC-2
VPPTPTIVTVSVRELVEFALRSGDLGGQRDFIGRDRALAGTRGHQQIQRSRAPGYQKEVRLSYDIVTEEVTLRIQGRIDGLHVRDKEVLLEEIKTVTGWWDREPEPLHWAQARIYGFIYAWNQGLDRVRLQLTYLNLDSGEIVEFVEDGPIADLAAFFERTTRIYLDWVLDYERWRRERNRSIQSLAFPFPDYRRGQRELAVAAYRAMTRGERLFLEAPTGIGKTISVLFPAVKALGEGKLERIFYLTARGTGQVIAEKAFADLRQASLCLRTLTLTAKEKICVREGRRCEMQTCPLARGYYDRRHAAMRAALTSQEINRTMLEKIGQEHQVCPFELSLDLSMWVDAVIGDYNYLFDPRAYLRRHFADEPGEYAFLVDEAHNLVDRAREMFSAELDTKDLLRVRRAIQQTLPRCAKALAKLGSALRKLRPSSPAEEEAEVSPTGLDPMLFTLEARDVPPPFTAARSVPSAGSITERLPAELAPSLERAMREMEAWLVRNESAAFREELLDLFFRLLAFARTAERYDDHYVTFIQGTGRVCVRLYCLDPSALVDQALARGRAAILFSATLTPLEYYRALLGGGPEDRTLRLASPFASENLGVLVNDQIRTHFKARAETLGEIAEAIRAMIEQRSGNYLVYFPSYQYLAAVLREFRTRCSTVPVLAQQPGMTESERATFLASFASQPKGALVGFAVLGGIFGEGIDLVGDRLIGAVIVGVGLPQLCLERDLIRDYFQERTGAGFEFAYTFPGMNRVLQATGRVIRSETDRGVVLLIDTRFAQHRYRQLFPPWWQTARVRNSNEIREALRQFWGDPA